MNQRYLKELAYIMLDHACFMYGFCLVGLILVEYI